MISVLFFKFKISYELNFVNVYFLDVLMTSGLLSISLGQQASTLVQVHR